jgi:hypothetical protein
MKSSYKSIPKKTSTPSEKQHWIEEVFTESKMTINV